MSEKLVYKFSIALLISSAFAAMEVNADSSIPLAISVDMSYWQLSSQTPDRREVNFVAKNKSRIENGVVSGTLLSVGAEGVTWKVDRTRIAMTKSGTQWVSDGLVDYDVGARNYMFSCTEHSSLLLDETFYLQNSKVYGKNYRVGILGMKQKLGYIPYAPTQPNSSLELARRYYCDQ